MAKHALSAKLDEDLLAEADRIARKEKIPRNRAIEEGLALWVEQKKREELALEMKLASLAVRKESRASSAQWETTLVDGLRKKLK